MKGWKVLPFQDIGRILNEEIVFFVLFICSLVGSLTRKQNPGHGGESAETEPLHHLGHPPPPRQPPAVGIGFLFM